MFLKVEILGDGPGPNETIIAIDTANGGKEQAVVSARSINTRKMLEVYGPLDSDHDRLLVELPRETMSGSWRVWVHEGALTSA